jgi:TldD protein
MTSTVNTDELFYGATGLDPDQASQITDDALAGMDDGELYLEYAQSESFSYDDGRLKSASFDVMQGFGLRAVAGEATGYAHAAELSAKAITRAAETVKTVRPTATSTVTPIPSTVLPLPRK